MTVTIYGERESQQFRRLRRGARATNWVVWIRRGRREDELSTLYDLWTSHDRESWDDFVGAAVAEHHLTDQEVLDVLQAVGDDPPAQVFFSTAASEFIRMNAPDSGRGRLAARLSRPRVGPHLPASLEGRSSDVFVPSMLAGNNSLDASTLGRLARHWDPSVRSAVAANAACDLPTLDLLGLDSDPNIRRACAGNTSTSLATLVRLCDDADFGVRAVAAANPETPDDAGRARMAEGEARRQEWLQRLSESSTRTVFEGWLDAIGVLIVEAVDLRIPNDDLARLSTWELRAIVGDEAIDVGTILALDCFKTTPSPTGRWLRWLVDLCHNRDLEDFQVARILNAAVLRAPAWGVSHDQEWRHLLASPHQRLFGENDSIPPDAPDFVLDRYLDSPRHNLRRHIAEHPNATPDMLRALAQDPHDPVRLAALRSLRGSRVLPAWTSPSPDELRRAYDQRPTAPPGAEPPSLHDFDFESASDEPPWT